MIRFSIGLLVFCFLAPAARSDDPAKSPAITYSNEIVRLLQQHCQECHRPGQAAPMSLLTYDETRPWAKAIRTAVSARLMPPFHAAGPFGMYENDLRLRQEDIDTIVAWIDAGAPRGNDADLPPPLTWNDDAWIMGEPDLVIKMPKLDLRTDGVDDNVNFFSEYVFPETIWIEGADVRPSNRKALHHANVFLTYPDEKVPDELISRDMSLPVLERRFVTQWLPGRKMQRLPDGQGLEIPKGTRLLLNAHFGPITEKSSEETTIALYFANRTIHSKYEFLFLPMVTLESDFIPAGEPGYHKSFSRRFTTEALVTNFSVHMHYRGKSAFITLTAPSGEVLRRLEVPHYDFNWQRMYYFHEPFRVPKGTIAKLEMTWDNSANNPQNPDPTQNIIFGPLTMNEMGGADIGYIQPGKPIDPPIEVRNGKQVAAGAPSAAP